MAAVDADEQRRFDSAFRRHAVEVGVRVALILAVVLVMPSLFTADVRYYWLHASGLSTTHLPYRDFLWEYPPVSALPLVLVPLAHHSFVAFLFLFAGTMAGLEYACFLLIRRTWPGRAGDIDMWWHVLALPLCTVAWFRLDFVAVLPATMALVALEQGRAADRSILVGIGAKLWPGVMAAAFLVRREWRALWMLTTAAMAGLLAWYAFSPSGVRAFLRFRQGSGLQIESTGGAVLRLLGHRPALVSGAWVVDVGRWRWVDPLGLAAVGTSVALLALGRGPWRVREDALVEFLGTCVTAMLLASRLFSAQFLVWLLPFVVVVAIRGGRREATMFAFAVACTLATVILYKPLVYGSPLWAVPVLARNVVLAWLGWSLLRRAVVRR